MLPKRIFLLLIFWMCAATSDTAAQSWTHFAPIGQPPSPQSAALIPVYDPSSNRMIIFSGLTYCCTAFNDVWVLLNANGQGGVPQWTALTPAGPQGFPSPRGHHSAVYDTANNRMIIFGGGQFNGNVFSVLFNDTWVLTNANGLGGIPTWIPVNPIGGPPAGRATHRAVYDPTSNRMIVFGGGNNGIMSVPNDVWVFTNANDLGGTPQWIQLNPTGQIPPPTEAFAAGYDPINNVLTIFGGCCGFNNNSYTLSNANGLGGTPQWTQLTPAGTLPSARGTWMYGYNPGRNQLLVFGLGAVNVLVNDFWTLSNANGLGGAPAWSNPIPNGDPGAPPTNDTLVGSVYDPVSDRLMFLRLGPDVPQGQGPQLWVLSPNPGPPAPAVSLSTNLLNFPNQMVNTTSAAMPVTVTNSGNASLNITAMPTISGPNAGDFAIVNGTTTCQSGATIAPGNSCVINVTFTPTTTTAESATLNISDNAGSGNQNVNLTGTGVAAPPTNPAPTISSLSDTTAQQRQVITKFIITGTNFQKGATVTFNPHDGIILGTPTVSASNQIVVLVVISTSASLGSRDIAVANPDGQASNLKLFTVAPLSSVPAPIGLGAVVGRGTVYLRWSPYYFQADAFEIRVVNASSLLRQSRIFRCQAPAIPNAGGLFDFHSSCLIDASFLSLLTAGGTSPDGFSFEFSVRAVLGSVQSNFSFPPITALPSQFDGASKPPASRNPILLLHGFVGNGSINGTWKDTVDFFRRTLGWKFGGELYHRGGELDPTWVSAGSCVPAKHITVPQLLDISFDDITACDDNVSVDTTASFFTAGFGNNLANYAGLTRGLSHQADEVEKFVQKLVDSGVPTPLVLVAHSNGGLAARDYVTRQRSNPRDLPPIAKLVTYGTPHRGADVQKLVDNLKSIPSAFCDVLPFPGVCNSGINVFTGIFEHSDGASDAMFACEPPDVMGGNVTYPSKDPTQPSFLKVLSSRSFPDGPLLYVAIAGTSTANYPFWPGFGDRRKNDDCHWAKWDGLVPIDSADISKVKNHPSLSKVRTFQTDRNHGEEGNDFPAILCALDDNCAVFKVMSPVDIEVIAPNGQEMARSFSSIPGASYMNIVETDGHETATVLVPYPQGGLYTIKAAPKPDAQPTDTFTITLTQNGVTTAIADHMKIQDIPPEGFHPHVNSRPFAKAGEDQTIECKGPNGTPVTLNGSASGDQDGDALTYVWTDSQGKIFGNTPEIRILAPMGTQTYSLNVTDPSGLSATAQTHVTVRDTTPPTIKVSASPRIIWPPDNKMVPVNVSIQAIDICDPNPTVTLMSIKSNDPDDDPKDIQGAVIGTDDQSFLLRARRADKGKRRAYTITYQVTDHSGNATTATAKVYVPRDRDDKRDDE